VAKAEIIEAESHAHAQHRPGCGKAGNASRKSQQNQPGCKHSRVHWVRPELVAEVKYLTWTGDNLLRQVVYEGLREDKPASEVRRPAPRPANGDER
jgi:ATP-dependent DNA ligase